MIASQHKPNMKISPSHTSASLNLHRTNQEILSILINSYKEIVEYYIPDEVTFNRVYDNFVKSIFEVEIKKKTNTGNYKLSPVFEYMFRDIYTSLFKSDIDIYDLIEMHLCMNNKEEFICFADNLMDLYCTDKSRFFYVFFGLCGRCNISNENEYFSLFQAYISGERMFNRAYILELLDIISESSLCNDILLDCLFDVYSVLAKINGSVDRQFPLDLEIALFNFGKQRIVASNKRSILCRSDVGMKFSKDMYDSLQSQEDKSLISEFVSEHSVVKQKMYFTFTGMLKSRETKVPEDELTEMLGDRKVFLSLICELNIFKLVFRSFASMLIESTENDELDESR